MNITDIIPGFIIGAVTAGVFFVLLLQISIAKDCQLLGQFRIDEEVYKCELIK